MQIDATSQTITAPAHVKMKLPLLRGQPDANVHGGDCAAAYRHDTTNQVPQNAFHDATSWTADLNGHDPGQVLLP